MKDFPQTIHFLSDDTTVELVGEIKGAKIRVANYVYTKSITNLDMVFSMFLSQIDNLHKSGLIKCQ